MAIVPFSLGALSQEGVRPLGSADISADLPLPSFVMMVMSLIGGLDKDDHEMTVMKGSKYPIQSHPFFEHSLSQTFLISAKMIINTKIAHCCGDI